MSIDGWTLGLQAINVIVLIWILSRFLFRPIADIIAARQAAAKKLLDDAEAARAGAEVARTAAEAETRRLQEARDARLRQAASDAEAAAGEILGSARADAAKLMDDARANAERLKAAKREEAEQQAASLAADIAAKLLARLPQDLLISGFARGLAQELKALPDSARSEIGADAPVRVLVSHALDEAERSQLTAAIEGALERPTTLSVAVDPGLIAGLEIETPHAKVSNSFREDLRRVREELSRERG